MKVLLGFLIVGIGAILGLILSTKYSERKKFYQDFNAFNKSFKSEIAFSKNTLKDVLQNNRENNSDFYQLLNNKFSDGRIKLEYLIDDEKTFVNNYIQMIGKTDAISQLKYLESTDDYIKDKLKESIEKHNKYKALYVKMGVLIGLIIYIAIL